MALRSFRANHNSGVWASATAERERGVTGDVTGRGRMTEKERKRDAKVTGREAGVLDDVAEKKREAAKGWGH